MSSLQWDKFDALAGSQRDNFEKLARSLIRLHYAKYGSFRATANQPGVEFHLKLDSTCALGAPSRWYGWQCRWYDLPKGRALRAARKKKIVESIQTTERVIPGITDWVLWTRFPLTAGDQKWFYALKTQMKLSLWNAADTEMLLSGDATILRTTFFGELVLTPENLAQLHNQSVASVSHRWLQAVHQRVASERIIRRMLGEASAWNDIGLVAARLTAAKKTLGAGKKLLESKLAALTEVFMEELDLAASVLKDAQALLDAGDFDLLRQTLESRPDKPDRKSSALPRFLRAAGFSFNFEATNALADLRDARTMLGDMDAYLGRGMIAVVADAGGGKTQLAAELTAPQKNRPSGILLHGRDLAAGQGLDDLARRMVFQGKPVPSMEALVGALDASGLRSSRRLPLVIDGLNEAENPGDWKAPLASLKVLLQRYANVLVVCTLRTGARRPMDGPRLYRSPIVETDTRSFFADLALPDDVERLEMDGFGEDTVDAIRRYFQYYRIQARDAEIPFDLLSNPLQLRLFCDVTNTKRDRDVGIEVMPRSLAALFERYLADATKRVADLSPRAFPYYPFDVLKVINKFGIHLWDAGARAVNETDFRKAVGDEGRPWHTSIIRLLEQEGVILRVEGETADKRSIIPVYDALGGYIIASAILSRLCSRPIYRVDQRSPKRLGVQRSV